MTVDVTMLITTYNRASQLSYSLERLTQVTMPDELIVVDDGSDDNTEEVCDSFKDRLPIQYIYNHQPYWAICSLARNIGFRHAKHDLVITSEPEMFFITDVLKQLVDIYEERGHLDVYKERGSHDEVVSAGKILFGKEGYVAPRMNAEGTGLDGDYVPSEGFTEAVGFVAPFVGLYPKHKVIEAGGWDEEFPGPWGWDDIDLLTRMRIMSCGQYIATEVIALHQDHGPKHRGDIDCVNEKYMQSKGFNGNERLDHPLLVANQNHEWGKIRERP